MCLSVEDVENSDARGVGAFKTGTATAV